MANFVTELTEAQLDKLFNDFVRADKDHSSDLDFVEFTALLGPYVKIEDQLASLFRVFDTNGDGKIDIKEFRAFLAVSVSGTPAEKLAVLFSLYDKDNNHTLSPDEIALLLQHLKAAVTKVLGFKDEEVSTNMAEGIVKKLDVNSDGKITLEEWLSAGIKVPALQSLLGLKAPTS